MTGTSPTFDAKPCGHYDSGRPGIVSNQERSSREESAAGPARDRQRSGAIDARLLVHPDRGRRPSGPSGSFTGANRNTIQWTAVSEIAPVSPVLVTTYPFDAGVATVSESCVCTSTSRERCSRSRWPRSRHDGDAKNRAETARDLTGPRVAAYCAPTMSERITTFEPGKVKPVLKRGGNIASG